MQKIDKHIEIVSTVMPGLSSMSQESREAIQAVLAKHYSRVGITLVNNISDLEKLVALKPDLVFLGMKFIPVNPELGFQDAERIWLSDYLEEYDIPYTGSGQMAHELELNKPLAKQRVLDMGLKTSPFYVASQSGSRTTGSRGLKFPLFVKPTDRGGGVGINSQSVVRSFDSLRSKVGSITADYQSDSLVEEYLPGREFSVAILREENLDEFIIMPIELVAEPDEQGSSMLSSEIKTANAEQVLEVKDNALRLNVCDLALGVFRALGARDYGRIDIRLDAFGAPHFLEANLLPSLINDYGSFPKACMLNIGLGYEAMLLTIVRLALGRDADIEETAFEPGPPNLLPSLKPLPQAV